MKCEIKAMPELHVAYVRQLGEYGGETCSKAFEELAVWAGPHGYFDSGFALSAYWDNPEETPAEECRMDACVAVPADTETEGAVQLQIIPAGDYAVCHFEIAQDEFQKAWEDTFGWFFSNGKTMADGKPCYEFYHNNGMEDPNGIWIFDICIPVKS